MTLLTDLRFALRSLARAKGLALTVIVTLALGIGANAAIFSVVRGVLLRPLVNRDEDRLDLHPPERAGGIGIENANFSVPEIQDLRASVKIADRLRRFLDDRLHDGRPRRAARGPRRRRRRARTSTSWGCSRCWAGCSAAATTARTPQARPC